MFRDAPFGLPILFGREYMSARTMRQLSLRASSTAISSLVHSGLQLEQLDAEAVLTRSNPAEVLQVVRDYRITPWACQPNPFAQSPHFRGTTTFLAHLKTQNRPDSAQGAPMSSLFKVAIPKLFVSYPGSHSHFGAPPQ